MSPNPSSLLIYKHLSLPHQLQPHLLRLLDVDGNPVRLHLYLIWELSYPQPVFPRPIILRTFTDDIILMCGTTRKSATIFLRPVLFLSISLNGRTRRCKTLGNVRRGPSLVTTSPTYRTVAPCCLHPNTSGGPVMGVLFDFVGDILCSIGLRPLTYFRLYCHCHSNKGQ